MSSVTINTQIHQSLTPSVVSFTVLRSSVTQLTLAAEDHPRNEERTVRSLDTSKMLVANISPVPAGCVEARPGPPPRAPSRHGREWWRSLSKFQKVQNENEPTREMTRSALRVASNVAAARLGGGLSSGAPPRGGPTTCSRSTPAWPTSRSCPTPPSWSTRTSSSQTPSRSGSSSSRWKSRDGP